MTDLRIGVLGAARIAPSALLAPAREVDGVTVTAIAARDRDRAQRFADRHAIARVLPGYDALIADPEIDAVYIPLPNGLHAGVDAGRHRGRQARAVREAVHLQRGAGQ